MSSSDSDSDYSGSASNASLGNVNTSYTSFNTSTSSAHASTSSHKFGTGRQAEPRRAARKEGASSEEGRAERRAKRETVIAEKKALLVPQVERAIKEASIIQSCAAALPSPPLPSPTSEIATDAFIGYLNVVRGVSSSKRYPLASTSPHLHTILAHPASLRILTLMAKEGYLFDPSHAAYADVLVREEVEEEDDDLADVSDEEDVIFKFYTRATPLTEIQTLLDHLDKLESLRPNHIIWTSVNRDQLKRLLELGLKKARIFYHGNTMYSVSGREEQTQEGEATLVAHWKTVTEQPMEAYRWKQLDRPCSSQYVFRTDESISGIEEVLVDAGGGTLLTLNQQPGGFANRIQYHPSLLPVQQAIQGLRAKDKPLYPNLQTSSPVAQYDAADVRQERVTNLLVALAKYCSKHPVDFGGVVAARALLEHIAELAGRISLEGRNAVRAHMRKDIPKEGLVVNDKTYDSPTAGRGPRNDLLIEEDARGLIDLLTGQRRPGQQAVDRRFPFLDLWCVTYKHPDWWIVVHIIVLVYWIHILRPKYVVIGAAKLAGLVEREIFSSVFKDDSLAAIQRKLDTYFRNDSDLFDSAFLASILEDPLSCPTTDSQAAITGNSKKAKKAREQAAEDSEARAVLVRVLVEWEELPLPRYITWVGIPRVAQLGPLETSYFATMGVLDGGFHAYQGWTRPLSMQLSQATQLMADLLELATSGIEMDGGWAQANAVVQKVDELARETGLKQALEAIRKELVDACTPIWSLTRLAQQHRKEQDDFDEDSWDEYSAQISAVHQAATAASVKAVGKPSSPERIAQANKLVQENRDAINARHLHKLHPCPTVIEAGPGSTAAWLWYAMRTTEGDSFLRAANGATQAGQKNLKATLAFKEKQLQGLQRARDSSEEAGTISRVEAEEWLAAEAKGTRVKQNSVNVLECLRCGEIMYCKNYGNWRVRVRHPCPQMQSDEIVDLDELKEGIKELRAEVALEEKAKGRITGMAASERSNFAVKLERFSPGGDGSKQWGKVKDDQTIQRNISDITEGLLKMPGQTGWKGADKEKHRRLEVSTENMGIRKVLSAEEF